MWVYPEGSATVYQGSFPEDWENKLEKYNATYNKKGLETLTFLSSNGQTVTVECIAKATFNERATLWGCPKGSNTIYHGSFPEDWETRLASYKPTYNSKCLLKTLTFSDNNNQMVTVECIT